MLDRPLPASLEAERLVLGSLLAGHLEPAHAAAVVAPEDFSLEAHRRIAALIADLAGRGGKGRWCAKRKAGVVLELLRGADLESTSRKYGVAAATLSEWRDTFLAGGAEALKVRQEDLVDEHGRRMKSVIAELAMENELLRDRIRRMEERSLFCGGGRGDEPCPLGLHRAILRAGSWGWAN
jgi:transposase